MSSLKTDLLSDTAKVAVPGDSGAHGAPGVEAVQSHYAAKDLTRTSTHDAEIDEDNLDHHVTTLVNASKDGTKFDPSYDAILKAVMKNAKSRDALMKGLMDHTKLSYSMDVADFPNAVEITSHYVQPTLSGIEKKLIPPHGTKGFTNQVYQVDGTDWILDVYAYRHAKSNNVTVIVLHSGSVVVSSGHVIINILDTFTLWTTPATAHKFHYPATYDSELEDHRYSYSIGYKHTINMMGPDGKNAIPVELLYNETFIAQGMGTDTESPYLKFLYSHAGRIHGMSVFNASFEVGTSIFIELVHGHFATTVWPLSAEQSRSTGRVEVKV